jgi:hypothetical protein
MDKRMTPEQARIADALCRGYCDRTVDVRGEEKFWFLDKMSPVIGCWILGMGRVLDEDEMPPRWRALLDRAACTDDAQDGARFDMVLDWVREVVLPAQRRRPYGDGYGAVWDTYRDMGGGCWSDVEVLTLAATDEAIAVYDSKAGCPAAVAARALAHRLEDALDPKADDAWSAVEAVDDAHDAAVSLELDPCALLERLLEARDE